MINLTGKKILVLGLGISGEAAAELILSRGAAVVVYDEASNAEINNRAVRLSSIGAEIILGKNAEPNMKDIDWMIVSPGVPLSHRLVRKAQEHAIPVIGELELGYRLLNCPLVAVTGTNGKTTTVSLLGEIFNQAGIPCVKGGNIGYPLSRIALSGEKDSLIVAEVSSFQLERIKLFCPKIAVLLNLAPDHLDRYQRMNNYLAAKLRIFANQGPGDKAVIAPDLVSEVRDYLPMETEMLTWGGKGPGVTIEKGLLFSGNSKSREMICTANEIALKGDHNLENIMAAVTVAVSYGVSSAIIRSVLVSFKGLSHRLEHVVTRNGVDYYNDSKATNPAAVIAALKSFSRPIIWLAGGSEKGLDLTPIRNNLPGPVKLAILMGESRDSLIKIITGRVPFQMVDDMEEAVAVASRQAQSGDVILLSPGYASFDMYKNYKERGEIYKRLVRN